MALVNDRTRFAGSVRFATLSRTFYGSCRSAGSRIAHASPSRNCLASDENSISLLSSFGGPPELLGAANGFRIDMLRKRVRKAVAALRSPEVRGFVNRRTQGLHQAHQFAASAQGFSLNTVPQLEAPPSPSVVP